jgi:acetyl-CoA acetyltransferase
MKMNAVIAGSGMTRFGKHFDKGLKALAAEAIDAAILDAGISKSDIQAAYMSNVGAAVITGQVCVPGQAVLRGMGIGKIPVVNVENACASAATAFNQAALMVSLGVYDIVLACGYEKLYHADKEKSFSVFKGAVDVENMAGLQQYVSSKMESLNIDVGDPSKRSLFMDIYATEAIDHMQKYGTTQEQFAAVSVKNSFHASLNDKAQFLDVLTLDDVLNAREIIFPLTLPMCSPIGDGAAAVIIMSPKKARELGVSQPVNILSSVLNSGWDYVAEDTHDTFTVAYESLYSSSGLGPEDVSCIELHDASAPSEIRQYEAMGLCGVGEGGAFVEAGHSTLGGKIPVNTSGGLLRKGHPIGATGIGQLCELADQLRGRCGGRQVENARIAMAENGGGFIGSDVAALVLTMLGKGW